MKFGVVTLLMCVASVVFLCENVKKMKMGGRLEDEPTIFPFTGLCSTNIFTETYDIHAVSTQ